MTRRGTIGLAALLAMALAAPLGAQNAGPGMHMHGADGTGHDMATMPGLRGLDASPEESFEMQVMFRNFPAIEREVTKLPNGIRAHTFSANPDLAAVIVSHVVGMIGRVEEGRDPQVFIQSPTLDILFERRASITTEIEATEAGVLVTQTSDDPEVVAALQLHAAEVSDMAARGMMAVHERMMTQAASN